MILDASAIVAVLADEPKAERIEAALGRFENVGIGAPTLLETTMVMAPRFRSGGTFVQQFLDGLGIEVIPFGEEAAAVAHTAFLRYGRGRHPAGLNFGDCMAYAVAKLSRQPLLCLGDDFAKTDLELVSL